MAGAQGPGRMLGAYHLGPFLGAGPIGDVFRAQSGADGREFAVKVLRPPLANNASVRQRFLAINATVAQLDHPHILPLEFSGEQGQQIFAVTPLVAQGSLMGRLASGRLSPKDIAPLFGQICDALHYVHSQGMTHGNLKPANILLYEGKHCMVGDFGQLWQVAEVDLTQTGVGTEAVLYMAPEQMEGYVDIRSDIYSLGAMLFHALTGSPPFTGKTPFEVLSRHQRQPIPSLQQASPPLPPGAMVFDEILRMALAKDPNSRFQTPLAMARAITEAGNLANELPSRALPIVGPNGQMPMLPPPGMMSPPTPSRPNPGYGPMPGQLPPGATPMPPYRPMPTPMPGNPAFGPRAMPPAGPQQMPPMQAPQMPNSRPRGPSQPMPQPPMGGMPPQSPPDDPLQWLIPDSSQGARPTPSRPMPPRPPNPDMADFLTARHAAPAPIPETVETSMIPPPSDRRDAWWENDEYDDEREYTGDQSRVRPRAWEDDSRSMSVPSMRAPSRPASRDRWEESDDRYPRRDQPDDEYSRELTGARVPSRPRPFTEASAAYPAMDDSPSMRQPRVGANVSAKPAPRSKKRRSRLPAILGSFIAVVLLANIGLLVLFAPQDCPGRICDSLHAKVAPIFGLSTPPTTALNASLTKKDSKFSTYDGATTPAAGAITITATGSKALDWQGSVDLPWVALSPTSGTLASGGVATLGLTFTPDSTVSIGDYTATVTFNAGTVSAQLKIPITVTAAPKMSLAETTLHLSACGQAQSAAIINSGGWPINGLTATASSSQLLARLSATTIAPGQSVQTSVMLQCAAPKVGYAVYLVAPAASATLLVTLG